MVKPALSVSRAWMAARQQLTAYDSFVSESQSGPPCSAKWTWQSISPGSSVAPGASMRVADPLLAGSLEAISTMRSSSTRTQASFKSGSRSAAVKTCPARIKSSLTAKMLPSTDDMPGSHWLITLSPENYAITRDQHFSLLGLRSRHRKKAERVALGDRVLYYVLTHRIFPATATVTSAYFEDRHPTWINPERKDDPFPYRVHTQPNLVLEAGEGLDAEALAPRLLYLKRWAPEMWYLALQGDVHLLSAQDFMLIEREMQRVAESRRSRRERVPHGAHAS